MAITFPLTGGAFMNKLKVVDMTFDLAENTNYLQTGGGELRVAAHGSRIWYGKIRTRLLPHVTAEEAMAQIRMIMNARAIFAVEAIHRKTSGLGSPTIAGVQNGYEISLAGVTGNAVIPVGAFFHFSYDGGRRALHQVVESVQASSGGVAPYFTVEPAIRPGWTVGAAVNFSSPACFARYEPKSLSVPTIRGVVMDGPSFGWRQTLEK